jgi:hypothetical protein
MDMWEGGGGVIFDKNLNNMWSKAMAKAIIYKIKEWKWKEKEERRSKKAIETLTIIEYATRRSIEKWTRAMFMQAWSLLTTRMYEIRVAHKPIRV